MASVFISHSSQDRTVTKQVAERLRAAGFAALFVDFDPEQGIPAGRSWERELYAQLRKTDAVIFLASEASVASRWCSIEIGLARSLGRPVFPVRLQPGGGVASAGRRAMDRPDRRRAGADPAAGRAALGGPGSGRLVCLGSGPLAVSGPGPVRPGGRGGVLRPPIGDPPAGGAADPDPCSTVRAGWWPWWAR